MKTPPQQRDQADQFDQRLITARPDGHAGNAAFVAKTMAAVRAAIPETAKPAETFSPSNRRIDITDKKGLFMKLRSLSKPALAMLAIALLLVVSGTAYAIYQTTRPPAKTPPAPHSVVDPTKDWTPYTSEAGKFSLRYPVSWVQPADKETCETGLLDRALYLGPDAQSVLNCGSDNFGQIVVSSADGDKTAEYALQAGYTKVKTTSVTVSGVTGKRSTAITAGGEGSGSHVDGTKVVQYVFFTNDTTYKAFYVQTPKGSTPSTNVSRDFDLMVTKTLAFLKGAPVAASSPATPPSPQAAPAPIPAPAPKPKAPAESQTPASGFCPGPETSPTITMTIGEATPRPRCQKVTAIQSLVVHNATGKTITVELAGRSFSLAPDQYNNIDEAFGSYLEPGVHTIKTSAYAGGNGPELWLQ